MNDWHAGRSSRAPSQSCAGSPQRRQASGQQMQHFRLCLQDNKIWQGMQVVCGSHADQGKSSCCRSAYLSSSASLSLSHVVQSSFGSPPFSAQHTAAPSMPPADFTRFANWTAFCSSLKKLSTTSDTPWSSTWGSKQQCLRLGPCIDRAVVACHCSGRAAAGCPFMQRSDTSIT